MEDVHNPAEFTALDSAQPLPPRGAVARLSGGPLVQRSLRHLLFFIALLTGIAISSPSDAFAQRGHGQARGGGGGGRGPAAVSRGSDRGPGGPQGGHGQVAVPRRYPPPGHGGHYGGYGPYRGYYGYGWGFYGGFYYPPFYSMWGWYPYPFGYPWYPYWGPYWGPYDNSASVRLQVSPREAEVYVDGYYAGIVDDFDGTFQRLHVGPGGHQITVWLAGYRSATEQMYFRPAASYKVTHSLEKLAAGQPNEPKPQPQPGARPPRDRGDAYGPPPEPEPDDPAPGPRRPEPRWPDPVGGEPRTTPPGEPRVSGQSSSFGTLVIRVQPDGAVVTIDGERWQGPDAQDRLTVQLSGGHHHVEIRKDGYVPYSTDVDVRPGDSTPLNVSLPSTDRQ